MKNVFSALNKMLNRMLEKNRTRRMQRRDKLFRSEKYETTTKKLIKLKQQKTCQKTEKQKESINRS